MLPTGVFTGRGRSHIKGLIPWGGLILWGRPDPMREGWSHLGGLIPSGRADPIGQGWSCGKGMILWVRDDSMGRADPVGRTDLIGESWSCERVTAIHLVSSGQGSNLSRHQFKKAPFIKFCIFAARCHHFFTSKAGWGRPQWNQGWNWRPFWHWGR